MEGRGTAAAKRSSSRARHSTKNTKKRNGYVGLIKDNFSMQLQEEIRYHMSGHILAKAVPFFNALEGLVDGAVARAFFTVSSASRSSASRSA